MIWIIGEYAEKIDNADESLQFFIDSFEDEDTSVQLQLVTAVVKLFLKKPKETKDMVKRILEMATEESDDADLKDRGYVYWRLLSADPKAAKAVVLAEKAVISDDSNQIEPQLLESLVRNLSTLSSVYHKPPEAFVSFVPHRVDIVVNNDDDESEDDSGDEEEQQQSEEEEEQSEEEDSKLMLLRMIWTIFSDFPSAMILLPQRRRQRNQTDWTIFLVCPAHHPHNNNNNVELHSLASGKGLDFTRCDRV